MADPTYKTMLKGGVTTSIDKDGLMTKSATWILIQTGVTNAYTSWKAFESTVTAWAGSIGDKWKEPVQDTNGRECSTYTESKLFRVTSINIDCPDRFTYEVTFNAEQNLSKVTKIGNIDVQIDNVNQKTMTLHYQVDLSTGDYSELATLFDVPGTSRTIFDGHVCLIESVNMTAINKTRYSIDVTLKDMAVMMIGKPKYSKNEFNQKTASVSWRYSADSFAALAIPESGEDASTWLGLSANSGYLISGVSCEPDGLLGYTVQIDAKYVADVVVKTDRKFSLNTDYAFESAAATEKSVTIVKQATEEDIADYEDIIGDEANSYGYPGMTVSDVTISESGRGDYEVTIELTDDNYTPNPRKHFQNNQNYLENQVEISINYSEIVLEASHLGYARGLSDMEWININNPPRTRFGFDMEPSTLAEMNDGWTEAAIVAAVRARKIGFSRVSKVYDKDGTQLTDAQISAITSTSQIGTIRLTDYVYAQPSHKTSNGKSIRNIYFIPWKAKDSALIFRQKSYRDSYPKDSNGNDIAMNKSWIGKSIPVVECTVGRYYKGKVSTVLRKKEHKFFEDATDALELRGITSYKTTNLSAEEVTDNKGKIWTKVTQTLAGLKGYYWNHDYVDGDLM